MPAKNIVKNYASDSYYHVYNRGVNKSEIFNDNEDYEVFIGLLKRYLSNQPQKNGNRQGYKKLTEDVALLSYCLMPNHFHLLLYEKSGEGMRELLKRVSVSYGMYFNKKYRRVGAVFQQRYRAVRIESDSQLAHISRYIHMNPKGYKEWPFSSLRYYLGSSKADWIHASWHPNVGDYLLYLEVYEDRREELEELKDELAG
ncbi:MAG: transposase [Candidatus Saccharimonas sp.]|nr:transposase [Candidatus Saccharimonas sp.]